METFLSNPAYIWLAFGAVLIAFEALTSPGLGVFLGGLGAICTGIIIASGVVEDVSMGLQFACFFGFTTLWAIVLWRPLLKFRSAGKDKNAAQYHDIVGDSAMVGERGLKRGDVGQVTWSGTLMNAELDDSSSVDSLPAGSHVKIMSVSGNTLKVIPK